MSPTRSASIVIIDLTLAGSIGTALARLLAESSESAHSLLEVSHFHHPVAKESTLRETLAGRTPDIVLLIVHSDLHQRCGDLLNLLKVKLGVPIVVALSDARDPQEMFSLLVQGADDFLTLPVDSTNVLPRLWRLLGSSSTHQRAQRELRTTVGLRQIIGASAVWIEQINKIPLIARCNANVLITGETGTGKELCARAIHYLSLRASAPFVPVNCGAIPENLFENELFGHAKGAFTDAGSTEVGLLGEADGGTLFLDEIDALTPTIQVKLLRFIQEREYRPLGSSKTREADVRIVAATNVNLENALRNGRFRRDLYYRINVVGISLPPLRERLGDIAFLARHFLKKHASRSNRPATDFTPSGVRLLETYDWPGNVRELEHVVERAVILSNTESIDSTHLSLSGPHVSSGPESFQDAKARTIAQFEKSYIEKLLIDCNGNISKAARAAQKNRRAFWELIRKHRIQTP